MSNRFAGTSTGYGQERRGQFNPRSGGRDRNDDYNSKSKSVRRQRDDDFEEEVDRSRDRKRLRREQRRDAKQARIQQHEALKLQKRYTQQQQQQQRGSTGHSAGGKKATPTPSQKTREKPVVRSGSSQPVRAESKKTRQPDSSKEESTSKQQSGVYIPPSARRAAGAASAAAATPPSVPKAAYVPPSARRAAAAASSASAPPVAVSRAVTLHVRRVMNKLTLDNVGPMAQQIVDLMQSESVPRSELIAELGRLMVENIRNTTELTTVTSYGFAGFLRGLQILFGAEVCRPVVEAVRDAAIAAMRASLPSRDAPLAPPVDDDRNERAAQGSCRVLSHLYCLDGVDAQYMISGLRDCVSSFGECGVVAALSIMRSCGKKLAVQRPVELNQMLTHFEAVAAEASGGSSRMSVLLSLCKEIARGHSQAGSRTVRGEEEVTQDEVSKSLLPLLQGAAKGAANDLRSLRKRLASQSVMSGAWKEDPSDVGMSMESDLDADDDDNEVEGEVEEELQGDEEADEDAEDGFDEEDDEGEEDAGEREQARAAQTKKEQITALRTLDKAISGQRFATEAKRQIFHCIASSTDDMDMFQMLINRDPSGSQMMDTMGVIIQCCYQDSLYNPVYGHVLQRLVSSKRAYRNNLQFALWDRIKAIRIEPVDVTGYVNLACLFSSLISSDVFHLAVLRGLDLEQTSKTVGLFTRILLLRLLVSLPEARLVALFFGGNGLSAHDLNADTSVLRKCLAAFIAKYFVDEDEARKWIPLFYDAVTASSHDDGQWSSTDGPQRLVKRIRTVYRALKEGVH